MAGRSGGLLGRRGPVLGPAWEQAQGHPELVEVFHAQEQARLARAEWLAGRLAQAGLLAPGLDQASAARLLWLLTGLHCLRQLALQDLDPQELVLTWARTIVPGTQG